MLTSTTPGIRSSRAGMEASLAIGRLLAQQVVNRLALAHEARAAVGDEHGGRPRDGVVVRAHGERVGARRGDGEQVASLWLGESHAFDQHVARLAVLAADVVRARGLFL